MRIISGRLRRQKILVPPGHAVRPTTDRAREAIFSMIDSRTDMVSATVLDLFAGSGALGLEALSRGAASVTFVERDPGTADFIRRNVASLGVGADCTLVVADAGRFLAQCGDEQFDLVFADPPYGYGDLDSLPDLILPAIRPAGFLILEHEERHDFGAHPRLLVRKSYGRTGISLFRPQQEETATR